jgi:hypothetical protein
MDALALRASPAAATFASLPPPLARLVFLALPPDARGRACCVCRAWRDALADPSLWTRLDMTLVDDDFYVVLRGAAGRARSQLRELDLQLDIVEMDDLLPVLTANAGSLRELHLHEVDGDGCFYGVSPTIAAVFAAAPLLQVLKAEEVTCTWNDAPRLLRSEPPFAPLQMLDRLSVQFDDIDGHRGGMECFGPFAAALADAALQPELSRVEIAFADTAQPAVMGALVDAALARRLRGLTLVGCTPPAPAPLARLLTEGSLAVLEISPSGSTPLFDAAGAALMAGALRVNTTLTELHLRDTCLSRDMRVAGLLLGALRWHPRLRELRISGEEPTTADARCTFGAALGALVAADAPALLVLDCYDNQLEDIGLATIMEALPRNRHLRELNVGNNGMSEAFAREQLLPAVRANTTLRSLRADSYPSMPAAAEAEELVNRRGQQG